MATTTNMSLTKWDQATDTFNYSQLASNFDKIDDHDHSNGKGTQIGAGGIQSSAITTIKINNGAVTTAKLADSTGVSDGIITSKLATGAVTAPKADATVVGPYQSSGSALPTAADGKQFWTTVNGSLTSSSGTTTSVPSCWNFKYSTASTKWFFSGGTPASVFNNQELTVTEGASSDPMTLVTNTGVAIPYKGYYLFQYSAQIYSTGVENDPKFYLEPKASSSAATSIVTEVDVLTATLGYYVITGSAIINVTNTTSTYGLYALATGGTYPAAVPKINNASLLITPIYVTT